MSEDEKNRVFIGEMIFRFAIIGKDDADVRGRMYDLRGKTYEDFKGALQYERFDFCSGLSAYLTR